MVDTNYIASIVKILENPISKSLNKTVLTTEFRAQLPQVRNNRIVNLVFWGNLAHDIINFYKVNDYIIIEGYLSLRDIDKNKKSNKIIKQNRKQVQITVFKAYFIKN